MNERRRYYRIKDTVSIQYKVLEGQYLEEEMHHATIGYVKYADLRNASHCIDARLESIARKLGRDNPLVAEALTLMIRKFAIMELMSGECKPEEVTQWPEQDVSISASGVAFLCKEEILEDTPLKLEVILHPQNHYIAILGRVVSCRKSDEDDGFIIAVDFENISEEDREHLIHHILKKQMEEIREKKNGPGNDQSLASI